MSVCTGCKKQCEYGYVCLSNGNYLPKLGDVFITAYVGENKEHIVLRPMEMTATSATAEALKIAKLCESRNGSDFASVAFVANQKTK